MQLGDRDAQFSRLKGHVYADHAGAGLHSDRQAQEIAALLTSELLLNPHSSPEAERAMDEAALSVLKFFSADPSVYSLVWTSGATAALKMVGENVDWGKTAPAFFYHRHSHNSLLGIREYARAGGAEVGVFDWEMTEPREEEAESGGFEKTDSKDSGGFETTAEEAFLRSPLASLKRGVVGISGQCNFSGAKPNLSFLRTRLAPGVFLLVDGASLASTSPVNVGNLRCDFFAVSFYKLFGLPSGLGALICHTARTQSVFSERKKYFGGGTVEASSASVTDFVRFRKSLAKRLQDGTPPFLAIASLKVGFSEMFRLSGGGMMEAIQRHTFLLAAKFAAELRSLAHFNGAPVAELYGQWNSENVWRNNQGPIVAFNIRAADRSFVGYSRVEKFAAVSAIRLRSGCFCNPGACETFLNLSHQRVLANLLRGKVCGDSNDVIDDRPTGCVRVSFGWCSTAEDVQKLCAFFCQCFSESAPPHPVELAHSANVWPKVAGIFLYPIKSCAAMAVNAWPIGQRGLKFDREFALVETVTGKVMTQKRFAKMALLESVISLERMTLTLNGALEIDIRSSTFPPNVGEKSAEDCAACVSSCGPLRPWGGAAASSFLQTFFGIECFLARSAVGKTLANSSDSFLVVSAESVTWLNEQYDLSVSAKRFRPTLLLSGGPGPHWEDDCVSFRLEKTDFVFGEKCGRCEMVNVDQDTGVVGTEPLRSLSRYRKDSGQIFFGSLFALRKAEAAEGATVAVGMSVEQ